MKEYSKGIYVKFKPEEVERLHNRMKEAGVQNMSAYCLVIELIQSRYGTEMSAVPNRRICSAVDSSIFTPNLSRIAFFVAIMHWFTPSFSVHHRLSCAFLLLIYRMFMVPFPISARRLVPLKSPSWFTIAGYPCG